jgi:YD repeat-containing protein
MQSMKTSEEVWKDQMVSWTDGATGNTCAMTYDAIGNMRTKGSRTFEWKLGRKLAKVTEGALECCYDYDHTGNRVKKTVTEGSTTVSTVYRMAGDLLLSEKTGAETIWYEYDSGANLISMKLNGTRYFYIRNLQNDIVGLTDPNGNVVVRYEYNAWGKLLNITGSLATTVGVKNPF